MELNYVLENAINLKKRLDELRPLDSETEQRVLQKIRLDWNYHSNHIEGGQLSFGETKALLLFGITAQGKPLQDHLEISGHDEAIKWIEEVVKDEYPLTENFIRQLHEIILVKDSYKEAKTPDGKIVKRKIQVGAYKNVPNHVETKTGEMFYFATPEETPAKMTELMAWYNQQKKREDVNPIIFAAEFHYKFIRIHPFDDGNGRLARLLMNCIMMQYGYPPAIIKTDDKENYYAALRQADAGIFDPFCAYVAENVISSLELMIKGAKGESIEEPDDIDKEIALLEQKISNAGDKIEKLKSKKVLQEFGEKELKKITYSFIKTCQKLSKFYVNSSFSYGHIAPRVWCDEYGQSEEDEYGNLVEYPAKEQTVFIKIDFEEKIQSILKQSIFYFEQGDNENQNYIDLICDFNTFNRTNIEAFNYQQILKIEFSRTHYVIKNMAGDSYSTLYHKEISDDLINEILKKDVKLHLQYIQKKLDENAENEVDFNDDLPF